MCPTEPVSWTAQNPSPTLGAVGWLLEDTSSCDWMQVKVPNLLLLETSVKGMRRKADGWLGVTIHVASNQPVFLFIAVNISKLNKGSLLQLANSHCCGMLGSSPHYCRTRHEISNSVSHVMAYKCSVYTDYCAPKDLFLSLVYKRQQIVPDHERVSRLIFRILIFSLQKENQNLYCVKVFPDRCISPKYLNQI